MTETWSPAKRWRREGVDRLRGFLMPEDVEQLWEFGYITQAQALSKNFWESDLRKILYKNFLSDMMGEIKVIMSVVASSE